MLNRSAVNPLKDVVKKHIDDNKRLPRGPTCNTTLTDVNNTVVNTLEHSEI